MKLSLAPFFGKTYTKASVAIGVVTILIVLWARLNDPHTKDVEQYLHVDSSLRESIGNINDLTLMRTTTLFRASGVDAAQGPVRKRYRFIAKGADRNAKVTVIVQISENDEVEPIKIENIDL